MRFSRRVIAATLVFSWFFIAGAQVKAVATEEISNKADLPWQAIKQENLSFMLFSSLPRNISLVKALQGLQEKQSELSALPSPALQSWYLASLLGKNPADLPDISPKPAGKSKSPELAIVRGDISPLDQMPSDILGVFLSRRFVDQPLTSQCLDYLALWQEMGDQTSQPVRQACLKLMGIKLTETNNASDHSTHNIAPADALEFARARLNGQKSFTNLPENQRFSDLLVPNALIEGNWLIQEAAATLAENLLANGWWDSETLAAKGFNKKKLPDSGLAFLLSGEKIDFADKQELLALFTKGGFGDNDFNRLLWKKLTANQQKINAIPAAWLPAVVTLGFAVGAVDDALYIAEEALKKPENMNPDSPIYQQWKYLVPLLAVARESAFTLYSFRPWSAAMTQKYGEKGTRAAEATTEVLAALGVEINITQPTHVPEAKNAAQALWQAAVFYGKAEEKGALYQAINGLLKQGEEKLARQLAISSLAQHLGMVVALEITDAPSLAEAKTPLAQSSDRPQSLDRPKSSDRQVEKTFLPAPKTDKSKDKADDDIKAPRGNSEVFINSHHGE
ncbi:MAG: hypothetical protein ACOYK8_09420 [Alphaproteobacteria bacterium]